MITVTELRRVQELNAARYKFATILKQFDSPHVWAKIGIVDINGADKREPKPSEHASFFHNEMRGFVDELSLLVIDKLTHKIKEIDLELSQYIKEPCK